VSSKRYLFKEAKVGEGGFWKSTGCHLPSTRSPGGMSDRRVSSKMLAQRWWDNQDRQKQEKRSLQRAYEGWVVFERPRIESEWKRG